MPYNSIIHGDDDAITIASAQGYFGHYDRISVDGWKLDRESKIVNVIDISQYTSGQILETGPHQFWYGVRGSPDTLYLHPTAKYAPHPRNCPPMPNDSKIPVKREDTRRGGEGGFTIKGGYGVLECTIVVKFPAPSPIEHDPM